MFAEILIMSGEPGVLKKEDKKIFKTFVNKIKVSV